MSEKKVVFLDIDGTLIPEGEDRIPDSALAAIRKAQEQGHYMFINTGRCLANVEDYLLKVGFDGFVCGCGTYIRYKDQVLLHHDNPMGLCRLIYDAAKKYHMDILFEASHGLYYDSEDISTPEAWALIRHLEKHYTVTPHITPDTLHFDKFITWTREESDLFRFIHTVAPYFSYIDRGGVFSEFVPKGFTKATGAQFVLNHFRLSWDNTYAIGDGNNDLPMLQYVKNSIAMGNASPTSLFDQVTHVTKRIDEDGIAYAFEHYILND